MTSSATDSQLLEVDGLEVRYGAVQALRALDFNIRPSEAIAILGPNGAGKTSLLRALSGLVEPTAGSIDFDGNELRRLPAYKIARAGLVHVPEGRGVIAPLTVRENLLMGAYALPSGEEEKRVEEMVTLFPALGRRFSMRAGLLSGGEQQMLAIARGLMPRPKLLVIDEPSMGLAPVIVDDVLDGLQRAMSEGVAMLLVEQNVRVALELAEHVHVLVNGEFVLSSPRSEVPEDLIAHYVEGG